MFKMSKVLKFIVHFVVICTILSILALALPPFFGVTTEIRDHADQESNLPMGSVTYAIPVKSSEMTVGDRIRIEAQIAVLKEIALDYKGKTIDNVIQQLELRLADLNLKQ